MSSVYQPKRKELANAKVISSTEYRNNRSRYKFIGSVQRGYTAFLTTAKNKKTGKCSFVDDTSSLTKKTKNEIVNFLSKKENSNKNVAYIVVPKSKIKSKK